jgi:hypothetical protein
VRERDCELTTGSDALTSRTTQGAELVECASGKMGVERLWNVLYEGAMTGGTDENCENDGKQRVAI